MLRITDFILDGNILTVTVQIEGDPERAYRVQIFLTGWNMGQYINDVGPQHTFVLPNGILRTSLQMRCCSSVPRMSSGSAKAPNGAPM